MQIFQLKISEVYFFIIIFRVSPLSPNHCTQVVRQEALITRFNDLYLRDRLTAMDILRGYSDNYENNQRIIFAAVQVLIH